MNTFLIVVQASLLNVIEPSNRSVSNHPSSSHGLGLLWHHGRTARTDPAIVRIPLDGITASFGLRHYLAGSPRRQAESSSSNPTDRSFTSSCSPPLSRGRSYFQLRSSNQTSTRTSTSLIQCAHRRTRSGTPCLTCSPISVANFRRHICFESLRTGILRGLG